MLILIGLVPTQFAMNMNQSHNEFSQVVSATEQLQRTLDDPDVRKKLAASG